MSYPQSAAIRTAITQLLRGSIGGVRTVPPGLFEPGVFAGQKPAAQKTKAMDERYVHRFDVSVARQVSNAATPLGVSSAPYRISGFSITVNVTTRLKAITLEAERQEQLAHIEGDCDVAIQALNYRHNLETTLDATPTGIVSGLLKGPDSAPTPVWELVEENWAEHLLRSRIVAEATVIQQQAIQ